MKLYRAATVCRIANIKPITLRQWHLRELYTPLPEQFKSTMPLLGALGSGPTKEGMAILQAAERAEREGWRAYAFEDIVAISIAVRLINFGITAERALMIAQEVGDTGKGYTICFEPTPRTKDPAGYHRALGDALTNGLGLGDITEHIRTELREPRASSHRLEVALLIDVGAITEEVRRKLDEGGDE